MLLTMLFILPGRRAELDIEALIDAHSGAVKRCAYLCLRDERLAEDMCQEVFLRLWQYPPRAENDAGVRAWLLRVTVNVCRDYLRTAWRRRVQPAEDELLSASPAPGPTPEGAALTQERDDALYDAVMALPLKYREPIIMHYYFDYTQQETARILDLNGATLRSRLMRARALLRSMLGEEVEP